MKNIEQLLTEFKIELSDENKEEFLKEFGSNYKTISEFAKKSDRIAALEKQLSDGSTQIEQLTSRIGELDGSDETIADLKNQIAAFEKEAEERKAAEQAARHDALLTENIMNAVGDRKFANDFMKDAVITKVKEKLNDDTTGLNAKDALEAVTRDVEGVWVNMQQQHSDNPSITENGGGKPEGGSFNIDEYLAKRGLDK